MRKIVLLISMFAGLGFAQQADYQINKIPYYLKPTNNDYPSIIDYSSKSTHGLPKIKSERKKRMKGDYKPDQPDQFMQFHNEIRTGVNESSPSYQSNYQQIEFEKAFKNKTLAKSMGNIEWKERGPGNVGGRTRAIVVDRSDATKKTWFAAAVSGGIWKTTDEGKTWIEKTKNIPNLATTCMEQSASNPDVLYAGSGEGFGNVDAVGGSGLYKSTDHGETWNLVTSTKNDYTFRNINRVIIDPKNENIVLLCANGGAGIASSIQKSTDGGQTWNKVYSDSKRIQQLATNPNSFDTLYAAVNSYGIIKSTDKGNSWLTASTGLTATGRIEFAISSLNPNKLYAAVDGGSAKSALFLSKDGGANWTEVLETTGKVQTWLSSQGWYDNTINISPLDDNKVFLGGVDLWQVSVSLVNDQYKGQFKKLTNWFAGLKNPSGGVYPYVHADQHNTTIVNNGSNTYRIIMGNDGGVFYSDNEGISWIEANNGYNTTQFYGADKKPGAEEFLGGMQDNGTWRSPIGSPASASAKYINSAGGDGYLGVWKYDDGNQVIGALYRNRFFKSTDNGKNFYSCTEGLLDFYDDTKAPFITVLGKTNSDPELLVTNGKNSLWRSEDFANSWTAAEMDKSVTWGYSGSHTPVEISLADPRVVWTGAYMQTGYPVQVSVDGGVTFKATNNYASFGRITGLASHPIDSKTAFALLSIAQKSKVLRTRDLGQTWEDISGFGSNKTSSNGFADCAVYDLLVMPYDTTVYWACTEIGIFQSTDAGKNWAYLNEPDFRAVSVWQANIVDDMVVLATHGRGIWTAKINELAGYKPPVVKLSPILSSAVAHPLGAGLNIRLRENYDSTLVYFDSTIKSKITSNQKADTLLIVPINETFNGKIQIVSYLNGQIYNSGKNIVSITPLKSPARAYTNNFNNSTDTDFLGSLSIKTTGGFSGAIHSPHPYTDKTNYIYTLQIPIIVDYNDPYIHYKDIAIVEPGDPGTIFGDDKFWDYVIVEASKNGSQWIALEDGYDCRKDTKWANAFGKSVTIDSTFFVSHTLDLSKKFKNGDVIMLRFRMLADDASNGYGWVIDDLEIQGKLTSVNESEDLPSDFKLQQNYPNPFNPITTIGFSLPKSSYVTLKVYNILGQEIMTIVNKELEAGYHTYKFSNTNLSSGTYIYRIEAGNFKDSKKMMMIK